MNKVVFTQDLPGERAWLKTVYPDCELMESKSSGKWNYTPPDSRCAVYEVPYFLDFDPDNMPLFDTCVKAIYSYGSLIDSKWHEADEFISNLNFYKTTDIFNISQQTFTFGRVGTRFFEDIADRMFLRFSNHHTNGSLFVNQAFVDHLKQNLDVTLFFNYRTNWWEWITSTIIAKKALSYMHYHTFDQDLWEALDPFSINEPMIKLLIDQAISQWNLFCNMRACLPNHKAALVKFEDLLCEFNSVCSHKKVPYNKKDKIINYDEAKDLFQAKYSVRLKTIEARAVRHLTTMGCKSKITKQDFNY